MLDKQQSQSVSPGSAAIQAGGDVIINNTGLSYSEVRQIASEIASDLFQSNFYQLVGIAKETATIRANELTEDFLEKLEKENPSGISKAKDPDFQYALYTAQMEYARCGDKDLEKLLVDLLVERSKQNERDLIQIVLNESLATAPKLTEGQLSSLSLIFFLRYTQNNNFFHINMLGIQLDKIAYPFIEKASKGDASYQHLEYTGCGSVSAFDVKIETLIGTKYQGFFQKGFDSNIFETILIPAAYFQQFFIPCLNNPEKLQVYAINKDILLKKFEECGINKDDQNKIINLFDQGTMDEVEIKSKLIEIRPYMADLLNLWSSTLMKNITLTSIGIAIGHANIKRHVGEYSNLSVWINNF